MNTVREYRSPLLIAAGALVVALLLYAIVVSPQSSKLSSLHNQETQLQTQQVGLDAKLAALKSEKQNLTKSCADLEKIATQIPSVKSPTDVDAEESSFESQFNGLAETSGVSLTQFSGFAPASTASASVTPTTGTGHEVGSGAGANHAHGDRRLRQDDRLHQRSGQLPTTVRDPDLRLELRRHRPAALVRFAEQHFVRARSSLGSSSHPHCGWVEQRPRRRQVRTVWPSPGRSTTPRPPTPWPPAPRPLPQSVRPASESNPVIGRPATATRWWSDPADLHVADGQGLAGGDAGEPLHIGPHRHQ